MSFEKLKVVQLKAELKKRGLKTNGKKAVLIERLKEYEANNTNDDSVKKSNDSDPETLDNQNTNQEIVTKAKDEAKTDIDQSDVKESNNQSQNKNESPNDTNESPEDKNESDDKSESANDKNESANDKNESPNDKSESANDKNEEKAERESHNEHQSLENVEQEEAKHSIQSSVIVITGFVRPFRKKQAEELFKSYGKVVRFWMNAIKSKSIVEYETVEEAQNAYNNINNIIWPPNSTSKLMINQESLDTLENALEEDKQKELKRQQELLAQKELERQKEIERQKEKELQLERERELEKTLKLEKERQKQKESNNQLLTTKCTPHITYKMVDANSVSNQNVSSKNRRVYNNDRRGYNNDRRGYNNDRRGYNNDRRGYNNRRNRGYNNDYRDSYRDYCRQGRIVKRKRSGDALNYLDRTGTNKKIRTKSPVGQWKRGNIID